jgi:hypothetical protein
LIGNDPGDEDMSTTATSTVAASLRTAAIEVRRCADEVATYLTFGRWLLRRFYRLFDGLPKPHDDVDLEVLKRAPPI